MREVKNQDIRREFTKRELYAYEVANLIGISASTLQIWMRQDLSPERRKRIIEALEEFDNQQEKGQEE